MFALQNLADRTGSTVHRTLNFTVKTTLLGTQLYCALFTAPTHPTNVMHAQTTLMDYLLPDFWTRPFVKARGAVEGVDMAYQCLAGSSHTSSALSVAALDQRSADVSRQCRF